MGKFRINGWWKKDMIECKQSFEEWEKQEERADKEEQFRVYQMWIWQIKNTLTKRIEILTKKGKQQETVKELEDLQTILFTSINQRQMENKTK